MDISEKQHRGNKEGAKLTTYPLPHATVRRIILSCMGHDKQLSQEAVQVACEFWESQICEWADKCLSVELEKVNGNPNKPKGRSYVYRRITGLMVSRALQRWREGG